MTTAIIPCEKCKRTRNQLDALLCGQEFYEFGHKPGARVVTLTDITVSWDGESDDNVMIGGGTNLDKIKPWMEYRLIEWEDLVEWEGVQE